VSKLASRPLAAQFGRIILLGAQYAFGAPENRADSRNQGKIKQMRNDRQRLSEEREVDLFDLMEGVWRQRLLVVVVASVITLIAALYVTIATPIYEAKIYLQPALESDIARLNFGRSSHEERLAPISSREVNDAYERNLLSDSLRQEFFQKVYLPSLGGRVSSASQNGLYAQFNGQLQVTIGSSPALRTNVTARAKDSHKAAEWAVQYAEMAGEQTKAELVRRVQADFKAAGDNMQRGIDADRLTAKRQREDRIVQLSEALQIARAIGLEKPPIISSNLSNELSAGMTGSLLYMRGAKALESEVEGLKNRSSDDPFVAGLRDREQKIDLYRSTNIAADDFRVYRQDGVVDTPDRPVKPKRLLLVLIGMLIGLFVGAMVALIREAWVLREARRQ